ncbi:MAG: type II secretion system F family protein [Clostridia bacterium]|nr:type II secretion system F family protein [Clostridia bacterium]
MATFVCKVMTPQGQTVSVTIKEKDKIACIKRLKDNEMTPIEINKKFDPFGIIASKSKVTASIHSRKNDNKPKVDFNKEVKLQNKVSLEELKKFTQEFCMLKESKFSNRDALTTIISSLENEKLKTVLEALVKNVEQEMFMYKAMQDYPSVFPSVYINLIKTGEVTGNLEESLHNAVTYIDGEILITNKIQKDILPNMLMFIAILVMLFVAMIIGVPVLQNIFIASGNVIKLPFITVALSKLANAILDIWYVLAIIIITAGIFLWRYLKTEKGRLKFDYLKYKNYIFGDITYSLDFSRFLRCLQINLRSKLRLEDALEISKNVVKNTYLLSTIEKAISNVYIGKSWVEPFEEDKLLNPIIIEILKKGNKTTMSEMLTKAVEYMNFEIEIQDNKLFKVLPGISYTIVGITILLFTITIIIPCIQIYLGGFLFI